MLPNELGNTFRAGENKFDNRQKERDTQFKDSLHTYTLTYKRESLNTISKNPNG